MAKQTLLEKALAIETKKKPNTVITEEEMELVIAWMMDQVTLTQAAKVMGYKTSGAFVSRVALVLREAYRQGHIKIKGV